MAERILAEKARDWDREPDERDADMPEVKAAAEPEPDRVDVDTLVDRPDLGPDAATLVVAGDVVPADLAALPRRPASQPAPESADKTHRGERTRR
jgi:hypothetical protein